MHSAMIDVENDMRMKYSELAHVLVVMIYVPFLNHHSSRIIQKCMKGIR